MTDADKEKFASKVTNAIASLESADAQILIKAIAALESSVSDPKKVLELLKKCGKEVAKNEKQKSYKIPDEWNKRGYDRAAQIQAQWALITLKAGLESNRCKTEDKDFEPSTYGTQMLAMLEALCAEITDTKSNLREFIDVLNTDFLKGPFGKCYAFDNARPAKWPTSALNIESVFETAIMPKYRAEKNHASLRNAWNKRIELEKMIAERNKDKENSTNGHPGADQIRKMFEQAGGMDVLAGSLGALGDSIEGLNGATTSVQIIDGKTGKRINMNSGDWSADKGGDASKIDPDDLTNSEKKRIKQLSWEKEVDCYIHGDEVQAAQNLYEMASAEPDKGVQMRRLKLIQGIIKKTAEKQPIDAQ